MLVGCAPGGESLPVDTTVATITGRATAGHALIARPGSWSHRPTGYAYQWECCDHAGSDCSLIAGAFNQTYTATANDTRFRLRVQVSASNGLGTGVPASSRVTTTIRAARRHRQR